MSLYITIGLISYILLIGVGSIYALQTGFISKKAELVFKIGIAVLVTIGIFCSVMIGVL